MAFMRQLSETEVPKNEISFDFQCFVLDCTISSLLQGSLHDTRRKQIETSEMVLLAVFVKDAPSAPLWHVLDSRKGVKVRDVAVVVRHSVW